MSKNWIYYTFAALSIILVALFTIYNPLNHSNDTSQQGFPRLFIPSQIEIIGVIDPQVEVASVKRLGVDLSDWTFYKSKLFNNNLNRLKTINPSYLRYEGCFSAKCLEADKLKLSHYSLSDFLNTCLQIGANPWIVIPAKESEVELDELGLFLKNHADKSLFSRIILEFSDADSNRKSGMVGMAAPILHEENSKNFSRIFPAVGLPINVIEATIGDYDESEDFTKGALSGVLFAKTLIQKLADSTQPVVVFNLIRSHDDLKSSPEMKISSLHQEESERVEYWRPAGFTAIMLNQVLGGSLHKINPQVSSNDIVPQKEHNLTMAAFRTGNQWSAAIVSLNENPAVLSIQFPDDELNLPNSLNVLHYSTHYLDNNVKEESVKIMSGKIQTDKRTITFNMPAYGFAVLTHSL